MRIVGGKYKGRAIVWPKTPLVRPITGLVCAALFNILGSVEDLSVLDAYAGAGTIGFEALSRGASNVVAVEMLPVAIKSIRQNVEALGVQGQHELAAMPIERWLKLGSKEHFDLIIAGPPFASLDTHVIEQLGSFLQENGNLVVWHSSRIPAPELESVSLTSSRIYGDSALSFYDKN